MIWVNYGTVDIVILNLPRPHTDSNECKCCDGEGQSTQEEKSMELFAKQGRIAENINLPVHWWALQ